MSCNVTTPQCEDQIRQKLDRHIFQRDDEFYYTHVYPEQQAMPTSPPEAYASAGQLGYNLVGLMVAVAMSAMSTPIEYVPTQIYTFNTEKKYKRMLNNLFSSLRNIFTDGVILAIQMGATVGDGGIAMYAYMMEQQYRYVDHLKQQSLQILMMLGEVKEIYYTELQVNPCAGIFIYDCLGVSGYGRASQRSLDENDIDQGRTNYNIFNPQRFENYILSGFIVEDIAMSTSEILHKYHIGIHNYKEDRLKILWTKDPDNDKQCVTGASFTQEMIKTKDVNNLIVRYYNKSKLDQSENYNKTLVFLGDKKVSKFFNAVSQFIYQPIITRYFYSIYLKEKEIDIPKYLQPVHITDLEQKGFTTQLSSIKFGFMGSGTMSLLAKNEFKNYMNAIASGNTANIINI